MPSAGFEPTISPGERPQTYALDRAVTGTDVQRYYCLNIMYVIVDFNHFSDFHNYDMILELLN